MESIMPWVGGKSSCADKIVDMMPGHYCYVECFAGGLWCYFAKPVSKVEVVNDLNGELVNFYRVIQRKRENFEERAKWELYSRELYYEYYRDWNSGLHFKMDDVERAFRFFVLIRWAYSAKFGGGWSYGPNRNKPKTFFDLFRDGSIEKVTKRLQETYIDNRDFEDVINGYDGENTLFMCCLSGTKIRMRDERLISIENIGVGDIVFAGGKVLNAMNREYIGNVHKINVLGIKDQLCITEEHPVGVFSGESIDLESVNLEAMSFWEQFFILVVKDLEYMEIGESCIYTLYDISKAVGGQMVPKTSITREINKIFYALEVPYICSTYRGNTRVLKYGDKWIDTKYSKTESKYNNITKARLVKWAIDVNRDMLNRVGIDVDSLICKMNDGKIEFVEAKNLKVGDNVLVPLGAENINETEKLKSMIGNCYENISGGVCYSDMDINIPLNYDTGWMFGMWLADGTKSEYRVGFDFGITKVIERNYDKKLYQWFLSNIGIELSIKEYERKERNREHCWTIRCNSKNISNWFSELFGEDKVINQEFMNYNLDFQRGLLRGWLDGDGHIANPDGKGIELGNVEIEGSSRRLDLIEKMYLISLRLGLRPSLSSKYCKSDGGTDYRLVYSNIKDASFIYYELFGNRKARNDNSRKKIVTVDNKKYMVTPIENIIIEHYEGKVYNLTTENSVYISNYTLTHNCDPPYVLANVDDYYFRSMGVSFKVGFNLGFTLYDHQRLYKVLSGMKGKFILTIDDCAWVRERYCDGQEELEKLGYRKFWWVDNEIYYTSSDMENRRVAKELIICNYNIQEQILKNKKFSRGKSGESLADY